jgi:hypothetical protein
MAKKKIINNDQLEAEQEVMVEETEVEIDSNDESEEQELGDEDYNSQEEELDDDDLEDQEEVDEEDLELEEEEDLELDDEDEFEEGETSESEADIAEPIAKELGIKEPKDQKKIVEVQDSQAEKKELEEFDESEFEEETAVGYGRNSAEPGVLMVVNSEQNGNKRVEIAKCVMKEIGNPQAVKIQLSADKLAISATLPNSPNAFKICKNIPKKKSTSTKKSTCDSATKEIIYKGIIYKADLIETITKKFGLDFTDRVCITFHEVEYKMSGDKVVAIITMK